MILAATRWSSNAELIADCAALGYIKKDSFTLDPTYGRGTWWKVFRPTVMIRHDLAIDGIDFRDLPELDETFDVVAFDPPYVAAGGRKTTTIPQFHARYGMTTAPKTPAQVQQLCNDGLTECVRVTKRRGKLLVKTQTYVSGGRLWLGSHLTLTHALSLGLECIDQMQHIGGARPQPKGRRQVHARQNYSTLFVFRKN